LEEARLQCTAPAVSKDGGLPAYEWNDSGNADRLADVHGKDLIYCRERKAYYVWSGQLWEYDDGLEVEKRAEFTMRNAFGEAGLIENVDKRQAFFGFVNKSLSLKGLTSLVQLTRKKVRIIGATELDRDPWLLNVENGTLDLRTGELRPHRREDLLSKLIRLHYDRSARCPLFMRVIYRIMGDGPDAPEADGSVPTGWCVTFRGSSGAAQRASRKSSSASSTANVEITGRRPF
jgi:putative DNA primase/helicase